MCKTQNDGLLVLTVTLTEAGQWPDKFSRERKPAEPAFCFLDGSNISVLWLSDVSAPTVTFSC